MNAINTYNSLLQTLPFNACIISYSKTNQTIDCISSNTHFEETLKTIATVNQPVFFQMLASQLGNFFCILSANKKVSNYIINFNLENNGHYFNFFGNNISENANEIIVFTGFFDITEQVENQKKIGVLADVFNFFSNAILIVNNKEKDYKIINANLAIRELCGYEPEELIKTRLLDLPIWINKKDIIKILYDLEESKKFYVKNRVIKINHKSGKIINAGIIINCIKDINNNIVRLNFMMSDITERINFQSQIAMKSAQLEVSNKIIKNMTHTITHKFSNYLSPISTYANLWIERIKKNNINIDDLSRTFNSLKKILDELNMFIDSSIKLARYDAEIIDIESINIREIFDKSAQFLADFADNKKIRFIIDIPQDINVFGSSFLIREVIDNMLNNAVKYSLEGSVINCGCRKLKNSYIWFSVENSGRPVPQELRRVIFKPYYRIPDSFDQPGDGLGLAICANIIKHHKGKIGVIPKKNYGNIFYFSLPSKPEFIIKSE